MAAFGAVIVVQFITGWLRGMYSRKFQASMAIEANVNFFWHVLRLPMDFFSQRYIGDLLFRQRSNQEITSTLVEKLAPLVVQLMLLVIYLLCMWSYSVSLTVIGLGSMLLNMLLARYIAYKRVDLTRISERDAGKYYGVTMSCLDNMETIKAAGAESGFMSLSLAMMSKSAADDIPLEKIAFSYNENVKANLRQVCTDYELHSVLNYI